MGGRETVLSLIWHIAVIRQRTAPNHGQHRLLSLYFWYLCTGPPVSNAWHFSWLLTMAELGYNSRRLLLQPDESVLDCLLRNGEAVPYSCKAGRCQACLIKAVDCESTPESRAGLKAALQEQGYTLACQWIPHNDVSAALPAVDEFSTVVRIAELQLLNDAVLRVRLTLEDPAALFVCRPGQYLSLIHPSGLTRSYSVANDFMHDQFIELHVGRTSHGLFSTWLFDHAESGNLMHVRGPAGNCSYSGLDGDDFPILLAGTGTGLAPLYGIAVDALRQDHRGTIGLYHSARTPQYFYYADKLHRLAKAHGNFHYHPCVTAPHAPGSTSRYGMEELLDAFLEQEKPPQTRVYLCGAPEFVQAMHKRLYLKGARAAHIHSDLFIERSVATNRRVEVIITE